MLIRLDVVELRKLNAKTSVGNDNAARWLHCLNWVTCVISDVADDKVQY